MKNVLLDTNQGSTNTIDGMPIGQLTPAPGNFSSLTVNGDPIIPGGGGSLIVSDGSTTIADVTTIVFSGAEVSGSSPNATVAVSGGSGATITVNISSVQLLALADDPPIIVPAPGVGKAIICSNIFFEYIVGSHHYDATGAVVLAYDNGDAGYKFAENTNFLDNTSKTVFLSLVQLPIGSNLGIDFSKIDNKAIIIDGPNLTSGPISTSTLDVGGAGYAPGDTGEVTVDSGDAIYVVDTVDGGGAVLTYHLSDPGTGFAVQTGAATAITTGGGDNNFTINITSVVLGNGTAKVKLTYIVIEKS